MGPAFIEAFQVPAPRQNELRPKLRIGVVFTQVEETRYALKTAANLSSGLDADIGLVATEVVPYPLPLSRPDIPPEFTINKLMDLGRGAAIQPNIYLYLCRDKVPTLLAVLQRYSIVVLGSTQRWFPTKPILLARALRKKGHQVILVKCRKSHT